jgi:hypothetical protein
VDEVGGAGMARIGEEDHVACGIGVGDGAPRRSGEEAAIGDDELAPAAGQGGGGVQALVGRLSLPGEGLGGGFPGRGGMVDCA